jgi:hypothetical protein
MICSVCCGTKRLVEVRCPADCTYLASAREHPPAALVRQRQRDLGLLAHFMRDLNEAQSQLFFLLSTYLHRYEPGDLQPLIDDDVADAAASLAATAETAARGLIYDHRPASFSGDRVAAALKPLLAEAGKDGGTAFERDAAVVLRRIEEAARGVRRLDPSNKRAFVDLLGRLTRKRDDEPSGVTASADPGPPRLIVP